MYVLPFPEKRIKPHPMMLNTPQDLISQEQGICNDDLNKKECYYDSGDCCHLRNFLRGDVKNQKQKQWFDQDDSVWYQTCKECECKDPCYEFRSTDEFMALFNNSKYYDISKIGNGICDEEYNFAQCAYDGKDCCPKSKKDKCDGDGGNGSPFNPDMCACRSGITLSFSDAKLRINKALFI